MSSNHSLLPSLHQIQEDMKEASLQRKIELGLLLWEAGDSIKKILDTLKEEIRKKAVSDSGGNPGSFVLEGDQNSQVTVIVSSPQLCIPRKKDLQNIKSALGSRFSLFFEEAIAYKPCKDFEQLVMEVQDPFEQKLLLNCVEHIVTTPRVLFKRREDPRTSDQGD